MNIGEIGRHFQRYVINNSPSILTAIAVTGVVSTAYLAGKASFKAAEILHEEESSQGYNLPGGKLELKEQFVLVWKLYIPAASTAAFTIAAIVCANRISARRAAALAAAYSISERAFDEYRAKVTEKLGEKKERAVRDELAQERLDRDPVTGREVIITGNGEVLCYDAYTGRYFTSTVERIRKAENNINHRILHEHHASLTDLYEEIGLAATKVSEEVGWNLDHLLEVDISAGMTDDSRPCLVLRFEVHPSRNYFRSL